MDKRTRYPASPLSFHTGSRPPNSRKALAAGLVASAGHRHDEPPANVRRRLGASFAVYVLTGLAGAVAAPAASGTRWGVPSASVADAPDVHHPSKEHS
ncbi:hypothetical protein [Streptomyces sp. WG7]|uniref:hypothetical protein n=1 Tax=Streptomyces sp. WG7 TaxID=3417650 RepID=UPI003CE7E3EF